MSFFRGFLAVFFLLLTIYTGVVIKAEGWSLLPVFIGDIAAMGWPGQFNLDFLGSLLLAGMWIAWRHRFSSAGIVLGLVASVGGMLFFMPYLLVASAIAGGDMKALLLGEQAGARR